MGRKVKINSDDQQFQQYHQQSEQSPLISNY